MRKEIIGSLIDRTIEMSKKLESDAKEGNIAAVQLALSGRHTLSQTSKRYGLLEKLIQQTKEFVRPYELFSVVTDKNFDFENFLSRKSNPLGFAMKDNGIVAINNDAFTDKEFLTMAATDPRPGVIKMAAILIAENLKISLTQGRMETSDLIQLHEEKGTLTDEIKKAQMRDAIIAVQNALVDYVREEGGVLPLNRGAAFLALVIHDYPDIAQLWTSQMTDITTLKKFSALKGDVSFAKPIYAPQQP